MCSSVVVYWFRRLMYRMVAGSNPISSSTVLATQHPVLYHHKAHKEVMTESHLYLIFVAERRCSGGYCQIKNRHFKGIG